jgi:hypothetical protein
MKDNSLARVGGICAILVGIFYIMTGVTYLLIPPEQNVGSIPEQFLASLLRDRTVLMLNYSGFILGAIFAFGAIPAISELARPANEGLVRWFTTLAYLGFALTAITYLRLVEYQPILAARFANGDAVTKAVMAGNVATLAGFDGQGWLRFGGVGLWVATVSLLGLRQGTLSKGPAIVGVCAGVLYWCIVIAWVSSVPPPYAIPLTAPITGSSVRSTALKAS